MLISLGKEQTIAKIAMLIKGESAHWLNQQEFLQGKFYWQDDYYAVSVSPPKYGEVKRYIRNQETHHASKPFANEIIGLSRIMNDRFG